MLNTIEEKIHDLQQELYNSVIKQKELFERIFTLEESFTKEITIRKDLKEYVHDYPEKNEGLNFIEAINLCLKGKQLRRKSWISDTRLRIYKYENPLRQSNEYVSIHDINIIDILAIDWEIVE
jgi:hypothetical protein